MRSIIDGVPSNLFAVTTRALNVVLGADPTQERRSICLMCARADDHKQAIVTLLVGGEANRGILSGLFGEDLAWDVHCIRYASLKLAYLIANPDAVTSFEGANPDEDLYGGGLRIKNKKLFIVPSGLSAEGDLVVGLLVVIMIGEINTTEAREVAENVSAECLALFDDTVVEIEDSIPEFSCPICRCPNTTHHKTGNDSSYLVCNECGHYAAWRS